MSALTSKIKDLNTQLAGIELQLKTLLDEIEGCLPAHKQDLAEGRQVNCAKWLAGIATEISALSALRGSVAVQIETLKVLAAGEAFASLRK